MKDEQKAALEAFQRGDGWMSLPEAIAHFTRVATNRLPHAKCVIGLDECAKKPPIVEAADALVLEGRSCGTRPLWSQLREDALGDPFFVVPATSRFKVRDGGTVVQGWSTSDWRVLSNLATLFMTADHVVLLSLNTALDKRGLQDLLKTEVRPALVEHHHNRFSLLVLLPLGRKADVRFSQFALEIGPTVGSHAFEPGYAERYI